MSQDVRGVRERVTEELRRAERAQTSPQAGVSGLARHGDPSLKERGQGQPAGGGGIEWVRASDVLQGRGARLAEGHAHAQEDLVKRMRHGMAAAMSRRGAARQASALPPVSGFGQTVRAAGREAVAR